MSSTLQASVFMREAYSENYASSDESYGVNTINWEDPSWKQLSLVNDEEVISLSHAKVYVFSDSVSLLE